MCRLSSLKLQHAHLNKEVFAARRRWESYVVERKSFAEVNVQNAPKPLSVPAVKLNVFSAEDGIGHIVEMTQSLSNAAQSGALSSKDIDINLVDKFLRKQDLTEPNLMIVIGGTPHKYVSLEGFPPWHVRLTEIVNMSGHDRIDYTLFLRSLYRYSKVEQRFGR
ncbi:hypothetical protein BC936DRAFT_138353 [Jimgerdemannia flammicorona]|uniref:ditrans,polycis-polyprenyl diphosphate synthase [(2E,6E)-farnesyldiphosphate specific] n=1 Tax=Jimgerdemannia flammicorona TaxID=994334 RepID=A0A433CL41_9FUNG|nr:hypothetical protein BC936DRAFT_138353 [Jimgerdemannia flammicorona]